MFIAGKTSRRRVERPFAMALAEELLRDALNRQYGCTVRWLQANLIADKVRTFKHGNEGDTRTLFERKLDESQERYIRIKALVGMLPANGSHRVQEVQATCRLWQLVPDETFWRPHYLLYYIEGRAYRIVYQEGYIRGTWESPSEGLTDFWSEMLVHRPREPRLA